jgi:hypothetical protein
MVPLGEEPQLLVQGTLLPLLPRGCSGRRHHPPEARRDDGNLIAPAWVWAHATEAHHTEIELMVSRCQVHAVHIVSLSHTSSHSAMSSHFGAVSLLPDPDHRLFPALLTFKPAAGDGGYDPLCRGDQGIL